MPKQQKINIISFWNFGNGKKDKKDVDRLFLI